MGAWHATCYAVLEGDPFPTALKPRLMERLYDDEDAVEEDPGMEPQDLDEQDFKADHYRY